ncbi:MAG TPA: hypothetical protein VNA29_06300 [Sphingomicrobium sp.]|nr:hypothetical protein [Sphingomicrobium sp.]
MDQPRSFGRGRTYALTAPAPAPAGVSDDLRLFAMTFAGGFLFMAVYLA